MRRPANFPILVASLGLLLTLSAGAQTTEDYTGLWWVSHGDGAPLQLRLYPDGSAWSDYPANNPGRWRVRKGRAECVWADDWKEALMCEGDAYIKYGFRPGQSLDSAPSNISRAVRASSRGDGWFGSRPYDGGLTLP